MRLYSLLVGVSLTAAARLPSPATSFRKTWSWRPGNAFAKVPRLIAMNLGCASNRQRHTRTETGIAVHARIARFGSVPGIKDLLK